MQAQCPSCGHAFNRTERSRLYSGGPIRPRTSPCPQCGTPLHWSYGPWRLQAMAILLLIPAIFLRELGPWRPLLSLLALLLIVTAFQRLKLVRSPLSADGEA